MRRIMCFLFTLVLTVGLISTNSFAAEVNSETPAETTEAEEDLQKAAASEMDAYYPAVTNLKASASGIGTVMLSWNKVQGASYYLVIGFGKNRSGKQIGYTSGTSYVDKQADSTGFNYYWVIPCGKTTDGKLVKGNISNYVYAIGRTVGQVSGLTAKSNASGISLSWKGASGANGYVIKSKTGSPKGSFNNEVIVSGTSYVDTAPAEGTTTYYWVYGIYESNSGTIAAAGKLSNYAWGVRVLVPAVLLEADSQGFVKDTGTHSVIFTAKPNVEVSSVTLYSGGKAVKKMVDDGAYSVSGDDIPNDNVYSAAVDISTAKQDNQVFYAVASASGKNITSSTVTISIYKDLTTTELKQIQETTADLKSLVTSSSYKGSTLGKKKSELTNLLNNLVSSGEIAKGSIVYNEEEKGYGFVYSSGVYGFVMVENFSSKTDGDMGEETAENPEETEAAVDAVVEEENLDDAETEEKQENEEEKQENEEDIIDEQETVISEEQKSEQEAEIEETQEEESLKESEEEKTEIEEEVVDTQENKMSERKRMASEYEAEQGEIGSAEALDYSAEGTKLYAAILYSRDVPGSTKYYNEWLKIQKTLQNNNIDTTINSNPTVENYKTAFSGKDLIMIHSHGSRVRVRENGAVRTVSATCLRDPVTESKSNAYADDLRQHRIIVATTNEGSFYWVTPYFYTYYYSGNNRISDAIVYLGQCSGYGGSSDPVDYLYGDNLIAAGASCVYGYHGEVYTDYNVNMATSIVNSLAAGSSSSQALADAKQKNGSADGSGTVLLLRGNQNKVLMGTGIQNPSFEESSSISNSKWKYGGDARIINKLASLTPQKGNRMAVITTGIGSLEKVYKSGTQGSYIYQYFKVPAKAKSLSFSYDIVSEEPLEWVDSEYDDRFYAELIDKNGNIIKQIALETVNNAKWYSISGINFEGGDDTTYHTTWKTVKDTTISKYAGQYVFLRFSVSDVGDSIYDTAALIDNIVIQ